jgi:hypothetical protein
MASLDLAGLEKYNFRSYSLGKGAVNLKSHETKDTITIQDFHGKLLFKVHPSVFCGFPPLYVWKAMMAESRRTKELHRFPDLPTEVRTDVYAKAFALLKVDSRVIALTEVRAFPTPLL